ncbi:neuropeptide Y receptor type 6-like [Parasteatoda tepidariorum]|uniref:neuropeptide Y receptor type 6-like n=1 Tax=Parasteatoda tepidariorum TaxID=114398 RepID=UPI001C718359|nr:neuropeptide Y receptor type 5-like [Parasteatoda tepidariorum]
MARFLFPLNGTELNFNFSFNFSISQALDVLDEHFSNDKIFGFGIETAIITSYTLLMSVGLCSNILVCSVILANTKIRSSRNVLVINLNVSDIILSVFCMPFTLMVIIRRSWFLGAFLCKMVPFIQASTIFVSAATVLAIAIDRYNTIINFNPQFPKNGKREMCLNAAFIWLTSLLLSVPICIFQDTVPVGLPGLHLYYKCVELWPSPAFKGVYTITILIFQFVIPSVALLVTHINIRTHLNERIIKSDSDSSSIDQSNMSNERLKRDLQRNTRATMVLLNISVVFTVSWLPWNGLNLLAEFHPNIMEPKNLYLAFAICHMTAMTSSITNPILYGWLNSNIRREMVRIGWVVAKASSALVSNRSSVTDNQRIQNNTLIRSSGADSTLKSNNNPESQV